MSALGWMSSVIDNGWYGLGEEEEGVDGERRLDKRSETEFGEGTGGAGVEERGWGM